MFTVITRLNDGEKIVAFEDTFETKAKALAYMREEVLWELTLSCECPELDIKLEGAFVFGGLE